MNRQKRQARNRRAASRQWLVLFAVLLCLGALVICLCLLWPDQDTATVPLDAEPAQTERLEPEQPETEEEETPVAEQGVVQITAIGDLRMSQLLLHGAQQDGGYDFSSSFFGVASLLDGSDLTVGNLECSFTGPGGEQTEGWAPDAFAQTLSGLGVDLLQTANSYSILGGVDGLARTMQIVEEAGMHSVGTCAGEDDTSHGVQVLEINGVKIAFTAFTKGLNNMSLPEGMEYAVNLLYQDYDTNYSRIAEDSITQVMRYAKAQNPDIIIALVHWGTEDDADVTQTQKKIADLLLDNGADAIIGTHTHLVGPIEQRTVRSGTGQKQTVIAYGLGDFYSDTKKTNQQQGIVLQLTFRRNQQGIVELESTEYVPIYKVIRGNSCQVWDARTAMQLYEEAYIGRVSEEDYKAIQTSLEEIANSVNPSTDESSAEDTE